MNPPLQTRVSPLMIRLNQAEQVNRTGAFFRCSKASGIVCSAAAIKSSLTPILIFLPSISTVAPPWTGDSPRRPGSLAFELSQF